MSIVCRVFRKCMPCLGLWAVAAALLGAPSIASAQQWNFPPPSFSLKTTVTIPNSNLNSFDISWVDPQTHTYTLSDRSDAGIDVIDTATNTFQTTLDAGGFAGIVSTAPNGTSCPPNACDGPNGNLVIDNNGVEQVWAGDASRMNDPTKPACPGRQTPTTGNFSPSATYSPNCSTVKVINLSTGALIAEIPTGGLFRDDELCYDPVDHLVSIANDSDEPYPYVNYISTDTYKVVRQINFDGLPGDGPAATNGIEQCQWNARNGRIYRNVPEVNGDGNDDAPGHVVIVDPKPIKVVNQFVVPLSQCAGPQGMAIGPAPEIMEGCNAKGPPETPTGCTAGPGGNCTGSGLQNTVVIDENDGHVIKTLDNQGGNDEVWFNPDNGFYFLAEGQNAAHDQLGIVSSQPISVTQDAVIAIPDGTGRAHSVAAGGNEVYWPIPNNVCTGAATCQTPCPATDIANNVGCVAVYTSSTPPRHFVYRGH